MAVVGILVVTAGIGFLCWDAADKVESAISADTSLAGKTSETIENPLSLSASGKEKGEAGKEIQMEEIVKDNNVPEKICDDTVISASIGIDRKKLLHSILFAMAVGVCSASYSTIDSLGVQRVPPMTYSFLFNFWANAILFPYLYKYHYEDCLLAYREQKLVIFKIAPGVVGSYLIILIVFSIDHIGVAVVVALRSSSVLMGALFGVVFLKERYSNIKFAAVVFILMGVVVIKFE